MYSDDDYSYDDVDDDAGDSCDDFDIDSGDSYDEGGDVDENGCDDAGNSGDTFGESDDENVNDNGDDPSEGGSYGAKDDVDEVWEKNDVDACGECDDEDMHDEDDDDSDFIYNGEYVREYCYSGFDNDGDCDDSVGEHVREYCYSGFDNDGDCDDNVGDDEEDDDCEINHSDYDFGGNSHRSEKAYLEFDGASRGNPGRAGGGALLKSADGTVITRVREGLGTDTNNAAEYKALIQGIKTAREMGYDRIEVKGDSELVIKQVEGKWQARNDKMARLCQEARKIAGQFEEFKISHVPRGLNADADSEANKAVNLPAGQVQREDNPHYRRGH